MLARQSALIRAAAHRHGDLRCNHVLVARQQLAQQLTDHPFARAHAVHIGAIEVEQALLDGGLEQRPGVVDPQRPIALVTATRLAKVHGAQAQPRYFQAAVRAELDGLEHVCGAVRCGLWDVGCGLVRLPARGAGARSAQRGWSRDRLLNPKLTQQLDWEVELAVVIGKKGKYVSKADAMDYVFGYTVINDISARDCRRSGQWIVSKGQDTFAPMGPILVTKDEISNPYDLNLSLKVNGVEKQNSNTKFMLFNISDLIEDLSTVFTIEAGDIIATGTPSGVGAGRSPQEWLWDGDVVEATVEGIGTITNTVKSI